MLVFASKLDVVGTFRRLFFDIFLNASYMKITDKKLREKKNRNIYGTTTFGEIVFNNLL